MTTDGSKASGRAPAIPAPRRADIGSKVEPALIAARFNSARARPTDVPCRADDLAVAFVPRAPPMERLLRDGSMREEQGNRQLWREACFHRWC
jgi:hypothetical protein